MEATVNRNDSLHIQENEFKNDRDRILSIMEDQGGTVSASDILRITRQSNFKTISVQSARSRLNELKNFFLIEEHHSSRNPLTGLNNTTYRMLTSFGSIAVIQNQITLYNNNINMISKDIETLKQMMFISEFSINLLNKQLIKFKIKLKGLFSALQHFNSK